MAIEWITVRNETEVGDAERLYYAESGDFGKPNRFPAMGFLHANFAEEQCIEWLTIPEFEKKLGNLRFEAEKLN